MSVSSAPTCHLRPAFSAFALASLTRRGSYRHRRFPHGQAQGTHLWSQSKLEEFEKGTPQGVAIESDGRLREGPGLKQVTITPSTFVWSVAVNKLGTAFVGTGSPGSVLRVAQTPGSKLFTLFETKDLSVQVVRFGPDGSLYAATLPSGKV